MSTNGFPNVRRNNVWNIQVSVWFQVSCEWGIRKCSHYLEETAVEVE